MSGSEEIRRRVKQALEALGRHTPEREAAVLALDDDDLPSPIPSMARLGFRLSDGATNRQLLDEVARRIGRSRLDREMRDHVQLPLREVGILAIATAVPTENRFLPNYWKPKSNNCVYVLDAEFRSLLRCSPNEFAARLDTWLAGTTTRMARRRTAESAAWASEEGTRLVSVALELYCPAFLPDFEVVYVDDRDGERIGHPYRDQVRKLRLPLDLSGRWPDIILWRRSGPSIWIVDCVETDGEVDYVRRNEIRLAFAHVGHDIAGFTTVYRDLKRFGQRQRTYDNIADDTYVWIVEIGGSHWRKHLPPQAPPGDPVALPVR